MICEFSTIDRYFADFICSEAGDSSPVLELVSSLASNSVGKGNICLDLADIAGSEMSVGGVGTRVPELEELRDYLGSLSVVGRGEFRPLVLDESDRLYLYRYWNYEKQLAGVILDKASGTCDGIDAEILADGLKRLFSQDGNLDVDWQKVAALAALRRRFTVISGGPGTGKTSTVVKILALLLEQVEGSCLRVALAAPTGKAAARLKESIRNMKEKLDCSNDVKDRIPEEVSTIHRLLGARGDSVRFRFSRENPLPFDTVVVDEASMVALPLMAKLAAALKPEARLILLGDRDQLASVEAGAVLGDICGGSKEEIFTREFAAFAKEVAGEEIPESAEGPRAPLADALVVLKHNYRFGDKSGIAAVSRAINAGEGGLSIDLLRESKVNDVSLQPLPDLHDLKTKLASEVAGGYGGYLAAQSPGEALALFDTFRILCAVRKGFHGVTGVNRLVEEILAEKGFIDPRNRWYKGRPVMITANDYGLKLFNGDVGIVFPDADSDGHPRVFFPAPEGGIRSFSPMRLPEHETVYAMTVHKSQGSEFDRVLLLLPESDSQVLSRELIYTGITRAKMEVEVWGSDEVLRTAISRRVERKSGLRDALWPPPWHIRYF